MANWQMTHHERQPEEACRSWLETFVVMTDERLAHAKALILESQRLREQARAAAVVRSDSEMTAKPSLILRVPAVRRVVVDASAS